MNCPICARENSGNSAPPLAMHCAGCAEDPHSSSHSGNKPTCFEMSLCYVILFRSADAELTLRTRDSSALHYSFIPAPEPGTGVLWLRGIGLMKAMRKRVAQLLRLDLGTHGSFVTPLGNHRFHPERIAQCAAGFPPWRISIFPHKFHLDGSRQTGQMVG